MSRFIRIFSLALAVLAAFSWHSVIVDSPKLLNWESLGSVAALVVGSFALWLLVTPRPQMHQSARSALPVLLAICAATAALTVSADTVIVSVLLLITLGAIAGVIWENKRSAAA